MCLFSRLSPWVISAVILQNVIVSYSNSPGATIIMMMDKKQQNGDIRSTLPYLLMSTESTNKNSNYNSSASIDLH